MADEQNKSQDGKNALAEYEAQQAAVRAKTERLRALRLAREAAAPPPAPKRTATGKARTGKSAKGSAKGSPESLSSWLKDQQNSGRRT
jgi:hypothetical protein